MFDFLGFKKQLGDVRAQVVRLNDSIKNKREEIDGLRNSPPPIDDIIALLCGDGGVVDRNAADYDAALSFTVNRLCRHPLDPMRANGIGILTAAPPNMSTSFKSIEAVLLALFRDEVKSALIKRIKAMPWPNGVGPRIADRPALIEKAERELAALEKGMANLREQIAQSGIII
jgi:hypothetical protein